VRRGDEGGLNAVRKLTGGYGVPFCPRVRRPRNKSVLTRDSAIARPGGGTRPPSAFPRAKKMPGSGAGLLQTKRHGEAGGPAPVRAYIEELLPGHPRRQDPAWPRVRPRSGRPADEVA